MRYCLSLNSGAHVFFKTFFKESIAYLLAFVVVSSFLYQAVSQITYYLRLICMPFLKFYLIGQFNF